MTSAEANSALSGCEVTKLEAATCQRYLAWLLGEDDAAKPQGATGLVWALAHCDEGVTWGRFDPKLNIWRLGNQVAPDVSPPIRRESLQEVRLFGQSGEVLIWRTEEGLQGRMLCDSGPSSSHTDPSIFIPPSNESRILRGSYVIRSYEHGFSRVGDVTGAEQVLPLEVTNEQLRSGQVRLEVRHYFESDASTGAVRVAASRLVGIIAGGKYGA